MASERVLITFEVDASGAIKQVDNVKKKIDGVRPAAKATQSGLSGLTSTLSKIGAVAFGAVAAFKAVTGSLRFFADSIEAAGEQQQVFDLLQSSVERLGGSYERLQPVLDSHFLAIQRNTRFGDDVSAKAMQQLIDNTGSLKSSYELLMPTMDLAVAKDMELSNAVKLVGMVFNGQLGTLSRYGIQLTETQKELIRTGTDAEKTAVLVELLDSKFGGAAEAAGAGFKDSLAGLGNAFGDITEAIGDFFVNSKVLPQIFTVIEEAMLSVATAVADLSVPFGELEDIVLGMDWQPVADAWNNLTDALKGFGDSVDWKTVKAGIVILLEIAKNKVAQDMNLIADSIRYIGEVLHLLGEGFSVAQATSLAATTAFVEAGEALSTVASHTAETQAALLDPFAQGPPPAAAKIVLPWLKVAAAQDLAYASLQKMYAQQEKYARENKMKKGMLETEQAIEKVIDELDVTTDAVKDLAIESELSTNKTRNSFSELADEIADTMGESLTVTILGDWDDFFDLLNNKFKETAETLITTFTDAFGEAFKGEGDGSLLSAFTEGWTAIKDKIDADPIGSAVGGIGGMFAASQGGGGFQGGFQGAMGGAMAGLGIGAAIYGGLAAMGPPGWIIAGVLALVGGIAGFMGGGSVTPNTRGAINFGTGRGQITGHRDQHVDDQIEDAWIRDRIEEWNEAYDGMAEIISLFGDPDLFASLGEISTISFTGAGDLNLWAQVFREQLIPEALREVFESAIGEGLGNLGVSDAKIKQLWAELDVMGTDRMIESLSTFVAAVVGQAEILEEMDWRTLLGDSQLNSMEQFSTMVGDVLEAIGLLTTGMDEMDIIQQAETALEVQQLVRQVRQAELQMLAQIDALQKNIGRSIDSTIEGIQLGGMEPGQQSEYFLGQIVSLMDQLNSGTIGSPEELQTVMSDLLGYIGQYQNVMGENLYVAGEDGIVPSEWLIDLLEEARGLANDQLEGFRDEIREQNESILQELRSINETLQLTTDERIEVDVDVTVDIQLDNDMLDAYIDRRIRYRTGEGEYGYVGGTS